MNKRRERLGKRAIINYKAIILVDRWIQKNFQGEGELLDQKWKPLAPATIEARRKGRKTGKGHRILQDTGMMRSNWKHYYNNKMAKITNQMPYAIYHDSEKPRKSNLPRRQIIPDKKHIIPQLMKLYKGHIRTSLR